MCMNSELVRKVEFNQHLFNFGAMQWHSWLRHCAIRRKVAGWIPDGVIGIFVDVILPDTPWPLG